MRTTKSLLSAAFVIAALGVIPALAQTSATYDVPFAFSVSGKTLPAGEYKIGVDNNRTGLVQIKSADGRATFTLTHSAGAGAPSAEPKLVFHRYGDQYFLAQVSTGEVRTPILELPSSKAEREAVTIAASRQVETVTLVAMR